MKDIVSRLFLTGILVLAGTTNLWSAEYFFDDFEDYITDNDLVAEGWKINDVNTPAENATWTITNPGGRVNPPTRDGTPSDGNFMISDSDAADGANPIGSGMSHDLWSPSFDCTTADKVWLHFDCSAQLNNNGFCVFDVDVSIDGGGSWQNVFRRVAPSRVAAEPFASVDNTDGFFGALDIDITDPAAGESNVIVRWRNFEPNDDWWIAIDDVLVDDQPPEQGQFTLLAEEDFSSGTLGFLTAMSLAIPPNEGNSTWTTNDACSRSVVNAGGVFPYMDGHGLNRLGTEFAILDSDCDPDPAQDEYLMTPVLDCSKATEVFLHWRSEIVVSENAVQEVLVSLDGGESFEMKPIFSYNNGGLYDPGEDPFYAERLFKVPEAAGEAEVVFAFHYQGQNNWWWAVDNVKVTANGDLNPRTCADQNFHVNYDETTGNVTGSWNGLPGDEGYKVFQDNRQIGGTLGSGERTFTDTSPPAGGLNIQYKLQTIVGGAVDLECESQSITTFVCPKNLKCVTDQSAKTVTLTWTKGTNLDATGIEIKRNGEVLVTLGLNVEQYVDNVEAGKFIYELSIVAGAGADPEQCSTPLSCEAVIMHPNYFFEDFDNFQTDADVTDAGWLIIDENNPIETSTWTITNPGHRANPAGLDGTPTKGNFMISDSDTQNGDNGAPGTGMSFDLWSPPIDLSDAQTAWLHFDCTAQLNNNGECVFDVDVSTDDGNSWENVFRRVAPGRSGAEPLPTMDNADGFFGRIDIDLTDYAAGESDVMIRWRHFEPSWDWFIAIDNVLVDNIPVEGGTSELLAEEDFSEGIPETWVVDSGFGNSPWTTEDLCQRSLLSAGGFFPDNFDGRGLHHFDEFFAIADGSCAMMDQDELLETPGVDCTNAKRVFLHVKSACVVSSDFKQDILLSIDGGETFDEDHPIFSYNTGALLDPGEDPFYGEYIFEIPAAAGEPNVVFGFLYRGAAGAGNDLWWWAVDDIKVTGDTAGGGELFIRGDVNNDSKLNLADAIAVLSYLFAGADAPGCPDAADTNDDGSLNLADAIATLSYLFSGSGPLPAPFPDCGEDLTEDSLPACVFDCH